MLRFRTLAAGAAAVGFAGALVAGTLAPPAGAAGDPAVGTQVLDMLCTSKAGSPVFTPLTISRCQDARPRDGFAIEELICEGLLEGTFESVTSPSRPNRVNWFCFHGHAHPVIVRPPAPTVAPWRRARSSDGTVSCTSSTTGCGPAGW